MAHGIDTTVVEIDPVVHAFAKKYFQLRENNVPVLSDAGRYTKKLADDAAGARFDYIVHDVFTGGAEPIDLFTLEFLQQLHTLLKPHGAIAIVRLCLLQISLYQTNILLELCRRPRPARPACHCAHH